MEKRYRSESPDDFFSVAEHFKFDPDEVCRVLRGELQCLVFRGFCPAADCEVLFNRFLTHPLTRVRSGDAVGRYLGTFHWQKEVEEYLGECRSMAPAVEQLVSSSGDDHGWRVFEDSLKERLAASSVILRRAIWRGQEVASPLIRAWDGRSDFSLVPHEDMAQCMDPGQLDFEIQSVPNFSVCSANLCIENAGGGQLVLWDRIPTAAERRRLGTEFTGGPYPLNFVEGRRRIDLDVRKGDLYVFNGATVHAVAATSGQRATISCLLGFNDEANVVMWT